MTIVYIMYEIAEGDTSLIENKDKD